MKEAGAIGHLLLDVDDIAEHGDSEHDQNMVKLRGPFKFGK